MCWAGNLLSPLPCTALFLHRNHAERCTILIVSICMKNAIYLFFFLPWQKPNKVKMNILAEEAPLPYFVNHIDVCMKRFWLQLCVHVRMSVWTVFYFFNVYDDLYKDLKKEKTSCICLKAFNLFCFCNCCSDIVQRFF